MITLSNNIDPKNYEQFMLWCTFYKNNLNPSMD